MKATSAGERKGKEGLEASLDREYTSLCSPVSFVHMFATNRYTGHGIGLGEREQKVCCILCADMTTGLLRTAQYVPQHTFASRGEGENVEDWRWQCINSKSVHLFTPETRALTLPGRETEEEGGEVWSVWANSM